MNRAAGLFKSWGLGLVNPCSAAGGRQETGFNYGVAITSLVHGEDEEHGVAELELLVVVPVEQLEEVVRLSPLLHILFRNT